MKPNEMLQTIQEVKPNSFIFEKHDALSAEVCREMINRFEECKEEHHQGYVGDQMLLNSDLKRSTDLFITGKKHWQDLDSILFKSLSAVLNEFSVAFPYFQGKFKDMGYGIQRTMAGEFYHWHIDGDSRTLSDRQLVAIWYLNDVDGEGGETEFAMQEVKIQPQVGKLLLFPPFWTHRHRGTTLKNGVKYIATTWVVFQ